MLAEEVGDLAVLVVTFGREEDLQLGLEGQVLADLRYREDDLLEGPVVPHDLDLTGVRGVVLEGHVGLRGRRGTLAATGGRRARGTGGARGREGREREGRVEVVVQLLVMFRQLF